MEETREQTKFSVGMFLMIILLSANMRACYTGVGAIITLIQDDLRMSGTAAGLLTTIPILVFAVVCPLSSALSDRLGLGRMIAAAVAIIGAGSVLRAFFGSTGLFAGTVVLSVGVGIMNSLMVGLIKLRFPNRAGLVTSAYTTVMSLTSAAAMSINVLAASAIGWRGDMAMWAAISVVTVIFWFPQAGKSHNHSSAQSGDKSPMSRLIRSGKAWCLSVYMGTQSLMFYCITAWLPTILQTKGMSLEGAANAATALQLLSLPTTLLVPILAGRISIRALSTLMNGCYVLGALLFYFADPAGLLIWAAITLLAVGLGTGFSACIFLFSLKTHTAQQAAALSGFAQCIGYILAAIGPVLMGALFDWRGTWDLPMLFCFGILLVMSCCAFFSSNREYIL